ncbi:MAG TPA: SMP-30/gluconolactonase/LRE family protein, partial [Candidatus Eisenbacteria bacterium]|nr:SMP-30/gluconolactonase/LRE family protein [Candidatus Eisenbacteria bacterium]
MKPKFLAASLLGIVLMYGSLPAQADDVPQNATFTTLITTPLAVEGLTGDAAGNLYTTGRGGNPCPVWRINLANPSLVVVGNVAALCSPSGIALNDVGDIFISQGSTVLTLTPNANNPPAAQTYATGVEGTNGLAFDKDGNLWTGDGTTGHGRVWKIGPGGGDCTAGAEDNCAEVFRIQPMLNGANFGGNLPGDGVGRRAVTVPVGAQQPLVANGLAFNTKGDLFVADTARGAIWKVEFNADGSLKSRTGCDETFTENTLCLDNIWVSHAYNEGTDGIALDRKGNIWSSANERNAIVVVTNKGQVIEIFRNPVNTNTQLRNAASNPADNNRILEFPTSPFLLGTVLCTSNSDGDRRDNSPNGAGEISPAGPNRGKISCMD